MLCSCRTPLGAWCTAGLNSAPALRCSRACPCATMSPCAATSPGMSDSARLVDGVALAVVGGALRLHAVQLAHGLALLLLGGRAAPLGGLALHRALLHLLLPHALLQALHRHLPLQQRLRIAARTHSTESGACRLCSDDWPQNGCKSVWASVTPCRSTGVSVYRQY